jgi:hypothetical protein
MYTYRELRETLEGRIQELGEGPGRRRFVEEIYESVGLRVHDEESGEMVESFDEVGRRVLADNRVKASQFSFAELAEAIGGHDFYESFRPNGNNRSDNLEIIEAGPGVDPTAFLNINTFSAAVGGLIEATILENFENAKFIGDEIFETIPTRKNGEKVIGTHGFASTDGDGTRQPGMPHPRSQFGERWVETPELTEKALACEVTQEAVFYDLTNEVLQRAAGVGEILGYGREKTMLRLFCGVANSYVYNGVAYDTYQASTPWINTHANVAADYTDIDNCINLFNNMTDPETSREILVMPDTIVHMPAKSSLWHHILNSTEHRVGDNGSFRAITTPPPSITAGYKLHSSIILRNIIDIEGGETAAEADDYWFIGQAKKGFKWMEAWPLRVRQASANEFVMLDRGLIAAYFANYRGVGAVWEPRYWVRNTED